MPQATNGTLNTCGVILNPVDGCQAGLPRNLSDAPGLLFQHGSHLDELLA